MEGIVIFMRFISPWTDHPLSSERGCQRQVSQGMKNSRCQLMKMELGWNFDFALGFFTYGVSSFSFHFFGFESCISWMTIGEQWNSL